MSSLPRYQRQALQDKLHQKPPRGFLDEDYVGFDTMGGTIERLAERLGESHEMTWRILCTARRLRIPKAKYEGCGRFSLERISEPEVTHLMKIIKHDQDLGTEEWEHAYVESPRPHYPGQAPPPRFPDEDEVAGITVGTIEELAEKLEVSHDRAWLVLETGYGFGKVKYYGTGRFSIETGFINTVIIPWTLWLAESFDWRNGGWTAMPCLGGRNCVKDKVCNCYLDYSKLE